MGRLTPSLLSGLVRDTARLFGPRTRRCWSSATHMHIEYKELPKERLERFSASVVDAVGRLEQVEWVEVNPHTRRVVVAFEPGTYTRDELVRLVDEAERAAEAAQFPQRGPTHPSDEDPATQMRVQLAANLVGTVVGLVLRVSPFKPSSVASNSSTVLSILKGVPSLREGLEDKFGTDRADLALDLGLAAAQGFAQRPLACLVDAIHKGLLLREIEARQRVWERREPQLCAQAGGQAGAEACARERPLELPRGPVEEYSDRAMFVSLGSFALSLLMTRSFQYATAALFGGLPRPAKLGRDAYCAELGSVLAGRNILIRDPEVLRRLDRIDTLVLQGELVQSKKFAVGHNLVANGEHDAHEARLKAEALFDPNHPVQMQRSGRWSLGPPEQVGVPMGPEQRWHQKELARRGALVLALAYDDRVAALVDVDVIPQTGVQELIDAAHESQMRVVIASDDERLLEEVDADDVITGGEGLHAGVRRLQEEGRSVALVGFGAAEDPTLGTSLAAADCGIGLCRRGEPPAWGAHILCGDDLSDVRFLLEACVTARAVSKQSVYVALGAAVVGTVVSAGGLLEMPTRRVLFIVNVATLVAMTNGVRSSYALRGRRLRAPRDPTPWHALETEGVLARLRSSAEGLSEQDAKRRRPPTPHKRSAVIDFAEACTDELFNPLAPLLAAGAGLSAAVGSLGDAAMVGGVVVFNALVGGAQRYRTERAIEHLFRQARRRVSVKREGGMHQIHVHDLVQGDIIALAAGDIVPADCRILHASSLEVDASSLTGESLPVRKSAEPSFEVHVPDRRSMLYEGTAIAAGHATAIVVAVGEDTEARRGALTTKGQPIQGGVEKRLRSLMSLTGPVALGAGIGVVGSGLLRGRRLEDLVGSAVSLAIAAVPEGLPLLATAAQLAAAERLSRRGALVRNHRCIEALGQIDVLCLDKTGTLTYGQIELCTISDGHTEERLGELDQRRIGTLSAAMRATPIDAHIERADPTDAALRRGAEGVDVHASTDLPGWERVAELAFEAERGYHGVLGRTREGAVLSVKGAPEVVLPHCAHMHTDSGVVELDPPLRHALERETERLARRGLRVLGVAERLADHEHPLDPSDLGHLTFRGFVTFNDPARATAALAIEGLRGAGIRTLMITGDHPSTAEAIAAELELLREGSVLTGAELNLLSDEELEARIADTAVFARVTPSQKVRIVRTLQRRGRTVAMAGDGSNDAPAIRLANVGVAIGEHSTTAARGAADIVFTDERIETLVDAIVEGRAMWSCVRDAVSILVGGNLGEIGFTLLGGLIDGRPPLNARQLLLVNLLTDVAPAMAIALRPPERTTLESLAQAGPDASLGEALDRDIATRALVTAAGAGGAWLVGRVTGSQARARTIGLTALVGSQLGQTLFSGGISLPVVATSVGSALALASIVQTPGLSRMFGCRPMGPIGWATAMAASAAATAASVLVPRLLQGWDKAAGDEREPASKGEESRRLGADSQGLELPELRASELPADLA